MNKVFIDGQAGTTGLQIHSRLAARDDITLLEISEADRKSPQAKQQILAEADVVILCLPDDAALETVELAAKLDTRILDASTAHRVNKDWVYGMAELTPQQRGLIKQAKYVSNPGCWPTGFLLPVRPLIEAGLIRQDAPLIINGVSGYSGGGKAMIERYEAREATHPQMLWYSRPYGLGLKHKHVPEMQTYSGMKTKPLFLPSVGHFVQGMLVNTALQPSFLTRKSSLSEVFDILSARYENEPRVRVHQCNDEAALDQGFLDPQDNNGSNRNDIFIFGNDEQILLVSCLDNLGKGASGAAVQNLNLMLGKEELTSLWV